MLPNGWADCSMIPLVGATGVAGITANIIVTREEIDAQTSIEDYAETQKQAMMKEIDRVETLNERATIEDDAPAVKYLERLMI